MVFETPALIAATVTLVPLMLFIMWMDLKYLLIPNWTVLTVLAIFIVTGIWGLDFEIFLYRLLHGFMFLLFAYCVFVLSNQNYGGGDLKLITVLVPFFVPQHIGYIMSVMLVLLLVGVPLFYFIRRRFRGRKTGWESLDNKGFFPMGILIGLTMCVYLSDLLITRLSYEWT